MKRRLLILGIAAIFILALLPTAVLAYDSGGETYNAHDYNAMVNFLNQPSAVKGQTNAQRLGYDISQPETWTDVVWSDDTEKRLVQIGSESGASAWTSKRLAGSMDLSNCTALEKINCDSNSMTALDVSGCTALQDLNCMDNQLTALDISGCTVLVNLICNFNMLTTLDISANTALEDLACYGNQLALLDVSTNKELKILVCSYNRLTALDVSANTALQNLSCSQNQLALLDVSTNTALKYLDCRENQLTTLDVSQCTALIDMDCGGNQLTALNLSECTALQKLKCDESVAVTGFTPLWVYFEYGLGLLVLGAVTAWILIRRRRKKRANH